MPSQSVHELALAVIAKGKTWTLSRAAAFWPRRLFDRVSLSLGPDNRSSQSTEERVQHFPAAPDPSLLALYFQFGRYLLIASSRPGSQPANLQGIWNDQVQPPWSSNWTSNINLEMNYWPVETCNLSECAEPLFDLVQDLSQTGYAAPARSCRQGVQVGGSNAAISLKISFWDDWAGACFLNGCGYWI